MQTVTSLNLSCQVSWLANADGALQNIIQRRDILPLLTSLVYDVWAGETLFGFANKFLVSRPVTRLCYIGTSRPFEENISSCANLDYLLVLPELTTIIAQQPGAFTRLKHLGVFRSSSSDDNDILQELRPLTALKLLHTIEFDHFILPKELDLFDLDSPDLFKPNQSLLERLGKEHHSLCRVHIAHIFPILDPAVDDMMWERQRDGTWAGRAIPPLDGWDILNGIDRKSVV